ncbi:MAG: hypothetical protein KF833_13455 [Verrucomicrobiae bacterium]|nr:hypothetical protein [Verrucomicrobiae bacterium]
MNAPRPSHPLPPLAGLASFEDAMTTGLSVEECVRRLKRFHYAFKRLHHAFIARLTAEPVYELKMAFSLHAHYCAEHATALRQRVGEMREPPLGLDVVPDASLESFFNEILMAPSTGELLLGLYLKAIPALDDAIAAHLRDTHPLADHPSIRILRFARLELEAMRLYGRQVLATLIPPPSSPQDAPWLDLLDALLAAAGGLDGTAAPVPCPLAPHYSLRPFRYDGTPRRDERFADPYNMGVNAEVFLYDPDLPPEAKTLMMFYKRLREIDVPEMMASIIAETPGKPWAYYRDMTRQLWDEARHAMMGEVGFVSLNIDWPSKVMVNFTWSLGLNTQLRPLERHAVLYFIEQGLMPRNGKRFEWEVAQAAGHPLATLFQDYDWADEVLHARVGRDWYVSEMGDPRKAVEFGDACWSRVLMDWNRWKDEGLTAHRNWWPDLYQAACDRSGTVPDPRALAYNTSYQTVRADLKPLTGSA